MTYAKALAGIVGAGVSAIVVALSGDGAFSAVELINVAIAIIGAVGVFYVPNAPNAPVAKAVVAALMAVLTLATNLIAGGLTVSEWLQLVVAAATALGVYGVRNSPAPPPYVA